MNAIVVADKNWCIGKDGGLLVHLSKDLKYFKEKTIGKTLIVGCCRPPVGGGGKSAARGQY